MVKDYFPPKIGPRARVYIFTTPIQHCAERPNLYIEAMRGGKRHID